MRKQETHQAEIEQLNEELRKAKAIALEAKDLYEFSPSGYFSLTREGIITRLNLAGAQILGKERNELLQTHFGFLMLLPFVRTEKLKKIVVVG
jgi:PAS domain-containing protein